MDIIIHESIKEDFEEWLRTHYKNAPIYFHNFLRWFNDLPTDLDNGYDFQSGVCKTYLRKHDIEVEVEKLGPDKQYRGNCYTAHIAGNGKVFLSFDYNEAEIAAINAGFQLRAEQLEVKEIWKK